MENDATHLTDAGAHALGMRAIETMAVADRLRAHKALERWAETDEGKAVIAEVGGVGQSHPLYLAWMAGWIAAWYAALTAPTESPH